MYICAYACVCLCVYLPVAVTCVHVSIYLYCACLSVCVWNTMYQHMDHSTDISKCIPPNGAESSCVVPSLMLSLGSLGDLTVQVMVQHGCRDIVFQNVLNISAYLLTVTAQLGCAWVIPESQCDSRTTL